MSRRRSCLPTRSPAGPSNLERAVIWFALAISLLSCLLCGLAPALAVARSDIQSALKDSSRGSTAGAEEPAIPASHDRRRGIRRRDAAGQRRHHDRKPSRSHPFESRIRSQECDHGAAWLPAATYDAERALRFYRQGAERIAALPGVRNVAVSTSLPQLNNQEVRFKEEGARSPRRGRAPRRALCRRRAGLLPHAGNSTEEGAFLYRGR